MGRRHLLAVVLGAAATLALSLPAPADAQTGSKPIQFKEGIQLQDASDWLTSRDRLEAALRKAAIDDGTQVRIYGTRYQSYLPHYYLGLALYHLRDCQGALQEWDKSLKDGAVQRTSEFETLRQLQIDCRTHLPVNMQQPRP
jgi:hypothetical protein